MKLEGDFFHSWLINVNKMKEHRCHLLSGYILHCSGEISLEVFFFLMSFALIYKICSIQLHLLLLFGH